MRFPRIRFPGFRVQRAPAIYGLADGLACAAGIVAGLSISHQSPVAIWAAALSAGVAEFPGMASGQYQSAPEDGVTAAVITGASSAAGAIAPAVPFLFASGTVAVAASAAVACVVCAVIAWLRPEHGWRAFAQSYGITGAAVGLCLLAGLWHPG